MRNKNRQQTNKQLQQSQKKPESREQLTFLEHIYELRSRIFWIIATLIVASAVGFQFKDALVAFITAPLHGQKLVYLTPGGGFSFIFTLCLYFGAFLTIPVAVYHLYRFLQPVMLHTSRRLLMGLVGLSMVMALLGAGFGYCIAIPAAINFLTGFAGQAVTANLTAESYLGFVMAYMFGLAALFQIPLIIFLIDHVRKFPPGSLLASQRFVIVGAMVAAAIITPTPDIVNQLIIAGPIITVYQFGVMAVYIRRRNGNKVAAVVAQPEPEPIPIDEPHVEDGEETSDSRAEEASIVVEAVAPGQAVSTKVSPKRTMRRSIDGFTTRVSVTAPVYTPAPSSLASLSRQKRSRPSTLRSIDGFSIV